MMTRSERMEYLIRYLAPAINIPKKEEEKWILLRSLLNIRAPLPVSKDFLEVQNEFLKVEISFKGITDISQLTPIRDQIYLWQGDITTLAADGIVNAANSRMLGCFLPCHHCIDNAIHTYAGVQLRIACAEQMHKQGFDEPVGRAKITSAYNLPSNYILHTVGPTINNQLTEKHCEQLAACYRSCLDLAVQHDLASLAFCCISTGEFHFPKKRAAEIAIQTVTDYNRLNKKIKVIFNVFKKADYDIYQELLRTD